MSANLMVRFMNNVLKEPYSGCWLWTGDKFTEGYGRLHVSGIGQMRAHRVSTILFKGGIPEGMYVLHKCDVRLCVNPDHLFFGTQADNIRDCCAKLRHPRGSCHGRSKLTEQQIKEIRSCAKRSAPKLSKDYNVSPTAIWDIRHSRTWTHIP